MKYGLDLLVGSSVLPCRPPPRQGMCVYACMHARNMLTLAVKHDVLRLEIPVDDALGMEMAQGQCDLSQVEAAETGQGKGRAKVG